MRKKIILYFIFCFYFLSAQNKDWRCVTPFKDDSNIKKVEISDDDIIYVLDKLRNRFSISNNNGKSWLVSERDGIKDFYLSNGLGGIILYSNKIHKSSTKFFTNSTVIQLPINTAKNLYFYNDSVGFITTTNGKILKTINKGDTWTVYNTPSSSEIRSIYFINNLTGFAITDSKQIIGTKDGGITWTITKTVTNDPEKIIFRNSTNGIAVGGDGIINYTNDGGDTWSTTEVDFSFNDIKIVSGDFFAVGYKSEIYSSQNGINWNVRKIESTTTNGYELTSFGYKNSKYFIGTSNSQNNTKIFYSPDLINWSSFEEGVRRTSLQHSYFFNADNAIAIGSSPNYTFENAALISNDGGKNWKNVNTGLGLFANIYAFAALPSGKVLIATNNNSFYQSSDFGNNWNSFSVPNIPSGNSIRKIVMFDNGDLYLYFFTSIQGPLNLIKYSPITSWSQPIVVNTLDYTIKSMEFVNSLVGYALTYSNVFSKTNDGGKTWNIIHNFPTIMTQEKILVINENTLYVGEEYTDDGGLTWKSFDEGFSLYDLSKTGIGYGVYSDWSLYKTLNYGNSWDSIFDESSFFYGTKMYGICSSADNVFLRGENSDIFIIDYIDSTLSVNDSNNIKESNILIYPNPSSELLNFISKNNIVDASIFNLAGQKIGYFNKIKDNSINISRLKTGTYVIVFVDKFGVSKSVKFLKK